MAENKKYIIKINGKPVEVTPEVYGEYYRMNRYARYQEERDRSHGKTLYSNLDSNEMLGEELISDQSALSTEDADIAHILSEKLHRCLEMLPDGERDLIQALYFDGLTEREYAIRIGVSQNTVNKRRHRILARLKIFMKIQKFLVVSPLGFSA